MNKDTRTSDFDQQFHVSAKSADNVEQLFQAAARVGVPTATERLTETLANSVSYRLYPALTYYSVNVKPSVAPKSTLAQIEKMLFLISS